jgi:hypothetical protein
MLNFLFIGLTLYMRKKWNPIINYHIKYDRIISYTNHIIISKSSYLASIFVPFLVF